MAKSTGSTDEDVGRPGPWKEGRYQRPGEPVEQSVRTPPKTSPGGKTPASTPVTRKDYEFPDRD
jgi:hypothetical protein